MNIILHILFFITKPAFEITEIQELLYFYSEEKKAKWF